MRKYAKFFVTPKGERAARGGHPWVFGEEVTKIEGEYANGDLVDVVTSKGKYLGTGFVNDHSKIRVRIISTNTNDKFDEAFWERRLRYALDYRLTVMGERDFNCCRLIFGEADMFPGLTVDRYNDLLVTQTLSLGIEMRKQMLFELLIKIMREMGQEIRGLYERNDVRIRLLEGMEEGKHWFATDLCPEPGAVTTEIVENGIEYTVDVENGQKTGFFLDQKYNRQAIAKIAKGKHVLDCFTHTGSFALNAGLAGARHVLGVDASELGVAQARENAALNGLSDRVEFLCADVFALLPELEAKGQKFDLVILDPPAFTKSRASVKKAVTGYREINLRAMKLIRDGGFLATCSCSHFVDYELFTQTIGQAARNVHKRLRQVEYRTQAPDHPILWDAEDSYYLKFYIFQVCDEK